MFSKLLKSAARKSLLEIFLSDSRQKYYLRELAVKIQYSPGSLQRELNSLVEDELLLAEKMGNLRFFSLNTKSPYVKELRQYLLSHPQDKAEPASKKPPIPKAMRAPEAPKPPKPPESLPKPQSKPVLERRPIPEAEPALRQAPTFTPTKSPVPSNVGYTPPSSPLSKPIFTKPHLEKPDLHPVDPKPNSDFDYPAVQAPPAFQYTSPSEEEHIEPPSLSYTPEMPAMPHAVDPSPSTTHPATHQNPPDEPGDDIRLHIA